MDTKQENRDQPRRTREQGGAERPRRAPQPENRAPRQASSQRKRPEAPEKRPQRSQGAVKAPQRPEGQAVRPKQETKREAPQKKPAQRQARRSREVPDDLSSTSRRAYGKTKPRKKTVVDKLSDVFLKGMERNAARKKAKEEALLRGHNRQRRKKQPIVAPTVIYTQPQAFNRNRLLIQLITVSAVVMAMVVGLSVFFKVGDITVTGAEVYTPWSVREASGISEGDNLFTFSRARAGALIKANLPYVKDVRFGIKLPDTVNIIIEEEDVVYSVQDENSQWWLINSNGRVVEQTTAGQAGNHTKIIGLTLKGPSPGSPAVAAEAKDLEPVETETTAATDPTETTAAETIPPVGVTGAQRLTATLKILTALEDNDIVGEAASVDVTRPEEIMLWYGSRYQVNLGDDSNLEYKVACMADVILQMSDYQSGILDISFRIWPDKVVYTPFA